MEDLLASMHKAVQSRLYIGAIRNPDDPTLQHIFQRRLISRALSL